MKLFASILAIVASKSLAECIDGWGDDENNCYPQDAVLTCSGTGFTLQLSKATMYTQKQKDFLQSDKEYAINTNGVSAGTFDENGDVTIDKNWNDVEGLIVTHSKNKINFEVEISAENPALEIGGKTLYFTRSPSFKMICSISDHVEVKLTESINVEVTDLGTSGSVGENGSNDVWSSIFELNAYSDDQFTRKITSDEPISLGSPVYGMIDSTDLPTSLQYFVSNCDAKASDDENETTKISIFNNYECYNSIFGDAESIFMGRSSSHASTTDYKFSFPAFAFDVLQNDQLYMVSRGTMISLNGFINGNGSQLMNPDIFGALYTLRIQY